jgi:hypothetical protein
VSADRRRAASLAAIQKRIDTPLSAAAVRAYLDDPISDAEREEVLSLVRWFRRRYRTGADRLEYVRRASRRSRKHETGANAENQPSRHGLR